MSQTTTIRLTRHISPQDKEVNDHLMLPFDVPDGIAELQIAYTYTREGSHEPHRSPDNLVDIGLLAPGGTPFPCERGFRGWSGTARHDIRLSADAATPGYLPGPITPGRWHVMLGAYKLLPEGTDCEVTIHLSPGPVGRDSFLPAVGQDSILPRVLRPGPAWFRGDLHCHTHHSDGRGPLENLLARAREARLDFLAVTDHNTVSHHADLAAYTGKDVLLIPGQEVTTYRGHANVWGCGEWMDFRCRTPQDMAWVVERAHRCGGLISLNHPKYDGPNWELGTDLDVDCVEVWQAPWFVSNCESLAFWEGMLNAGRRVPCVGGSDCHIAATPESQPIPYLGQPTTLVWAEELSVNGILDAIRAGHVHITSGPDGPHLRLETLAGGQQAMAGDLLRAAPGEEVLFRVGAQGGDGMWLRIVSGGREVARWTVEGDDFAAEWKTLARGDAWYRLDLLYPLSPEEEHDPTAVLLEGMTNPIYVRAQP